VIGLESRSSKLIVEKSTVPLQTGGMLLRALTAYGRKTGHKYHVASNPEFLRAGTAIRDFMHPDRIVVGVNDKLAEERLREVYAPLVAGHFSCPIHSNGCPKTSVPPLIVTRGNSAELIKHAYNSFLALKISYVNLSVDAHEDSLVDTKRIGWRAPPIVALHPSSGATSLVPVAAAKRSRSAAAPPERVKFKEKVQHAPTTGRGATRRAGSGGECRYGQRHPAGRRMDRCPADCN